MSHKYAIDAIPNDVRALQVSALRVVAHTMGPIIPGGQLSQNHWSVYLIVPQGSVRLNMTLAYPDASDDSGLLEVSFVAYQESRTAVAYWDLGVGPKAAVWQFTNSILAKRRQNYRMAVNGVGCRWWILTVLHDWQTENLAGTHTTAGQSIDTVIQYNWSRGQTPILLEIKQGRFV